MSGTGSSLLHLSAFKGNVDILKDLLDRGLDAFQKNTKQGDTCLHLAIRKRHTEYVYELVRHCVSKGISS